MRRFHPLSAVVLVLLLTAVAPAQQALEFVKDGSPHNLTVYLGDAQSQGDHLKIGPYAAGYDTAFDGHYASILAVTETRFTADPLRVTLDLALTRHDTLDQPLQFDVNIGCQYYEFTFADGLVTFKGIQLDATRYDAYGITAYGQPVRVDGQRFTLALERDGARVRILLDGKVLQVLDVEAASGAVGLSLPRNHLVRAKDADDVRATVSLHAMTVAGTPMDVSSERRAWEERVGVSARLMKRVGDAYAYFADDPALPNVLLIGDSISIYYTDPARRLLRGKADVCRTPMGPGKAETLFASLDDFLAERRWDVIHFNTGLHDLSARWGTDEELAAYEKNLRLIVEKLQKTGARLIWASTTPIPAATTASHPGVELKYNAVAARVMNEHGIPINDLHAAMVPHHDKYWLKPNNIHFNAAGSDFLGHVVTDALLKELAQLGAPRETAALDRPIRVACCGDSITKGRGDDSYPAQLGRMLGDGWDVRNFGHNGTVARRSGGRTYWSVPEFEAATAFEPDIVVLMLGTNDAASDEAHRAQFAPGFTAMIEHMRALPSNPRVIVCTPPPLMPGRDDARMTNLRDEMAAQARRTAQDKGLELVELQTLESLADPAMYPDKVHPDAAGAKLIAEQVHRALTTNN